MQIQKLDTIIMNICILINIYSIYLLYKEVFNVKLQLDDIACKLGVTETKEIPVTKVVTSEKEVIEPTCKDETTEKKEKSKD